MGESTIEIALLQSYHWLTFDLLTASNGNLLGSAQFLASTKITWISPNQENRFSGKTATLPASSLNLI